MCEREAREAREARQVRGARRRTNLPSKWSPCVSSNSKLIVESSCAMVIDHVSSPRQKYSTPLYPSASVPMYVVPSESATISYSPSPHPSPSESYMISL